MYLACPCFNPRTHEECDSVCHDVLATFIMFQSTHSRRVRHQHYLLHLRLNVSIHALTKSATGCIRTPSIRNGCFNPRTHEECDLAQSFRYRLRDSFNPRTHEECDKFLTASGQNKQVSIHALTKSATFSFNDFIGITKMFQSTHSRRVRRVVCPGKNSLNTFQSTHSRRVRQVLRTHQMWAYPVSIHALTKSATPQSNPLLLLDMFQSTHSRRVRPDKRLFRTVVSCVSIHALTKSATRLVLL